MSSIINAGTSGLVLTGSTSTVLSLATNGTNRVNIDTSGNISAATGNLTFSSTGQRITGDMSNATVANRLALQATGVEQNAIIPVFNTRASNGASVFQFYNNTDATNNSYAQIGIGGSTLQIISDKNGTGSYFPIVFTTGGSERMRLDTSGNLGIGATPASRLDVVGSAAGAVQQFLKNSNGSTNSSAEMVFGTWSGATPSAPQAKIAVINMASSDARSDLAFSTYTGAALTERMRIDSSGKITDQYGNIRAIPQSGSDKTTSYTLATTDVGRFIGVGSGGSITVPDATFATGDVVSIFNNTTGNVTLTMTITTAYIGGTNTDKATITLATRGVATVLFISGTVCVVNGNVS